MTENAVRSCLYNKLASNGWWCIKLTLSIGGFPDVLGLRDGRAIFIEVKRPDKHPTKLQAYILSKLSKYGFLATYVNSIESINELIEKNNL